MQFEKKSIIYPLPTDELIERKERIWRLELPKSYKSILQQWNGAVPQKNTFACRKHSYMIERFLCILSSPREIELGMYDVSVVITQTYERLSNDPDLLGVNVLPIAALFAGDLVCLDFRDRPEEPRVCVWSHENSSELNPVLYPVADTFEDFIALLK